MARTPELTSPLSLQTADEVRALLRAINRSVPRPNAVQYPGRVVLLLRDGPGVPAVLVAAALLEASVAELEVVWVRSASSGRSGKSGGELDLLGERMSCSGVSFVQLALEDLAGFLSLRSAVPCFAPRFCGAESVHLAEETESIVPVELDSPWELGREAREDPSGDLLPRMRWYWRRGAHMLCGRVLDTVGCHSAALVHYGPVLEMDPVQPQVITCAGRAMVAAGLAPSQAFSRTSYRIPPCDVTLARWTVADVAETWFRDLNTLPSAAVEAQTSQTVGLLAAYSWLVPFFLAIAAVLIRAGQKVELYWLPHFRAHARDADWETLLIESEMRLLAQRALHPALRVIALRDVEGDPLDEAQREVVERQSRVDTQIHLQTPTVDLKLAPDAQHYTFRTERNAAFARRFATLLKSGAVDRWILHNGGAVEYGIAHTMCSAAGVSSINLEFDVRADRILLSVDRPFGDYDLEAAWTIWSQRSPTEAERDGVVQRALAMEDPRFYDEGWVEALQREAPKSQEEVLKALDLDPRRSITLLLPNVDFDTVVLSPRAHTIFPNTRAWILETVRFFVSRAEHQLVIRLHPHERKVDPTRSVAHAIRARWPRLPSNLRLIEPEVAINTYSLMEAADFGLSYATDAGLEMVIRGKPVISAGRGKHYGKGITIDPGSRNEYFMEIERRLANRTAPSNLAEMRERALLFAKLLWDEIHKPFPWRPGAVVGRVATEPLSEVLASQGRRYDEAFLVLRGVDVGYAGMVGPLQH